MLWLSCVSDWVNRQTVTVSSLTELVAEAVLVAKLAMQRILPERFTEL